MSGVYPSCRITILSTPRVLTKRVRPGGRIEAYDKARHFDVDTVEVSGLDDIADLLRRLIRDPHRAVIRAAPIDKTKHVLRRLHPDKTGEAARFEEQPRLWVPLDVEGIELPPGLDPTDLAGCARYVIDKLPEEFRGARCIVQATSSHGIKPDIRLRLWFWLSRPTTSDELKRWLAPARHCVDPATLHPISLTYTSAPVFLDGAVDPVPERLAELPGADCVLVPSADALAEPARPERRQRIAEGAPYIGPAAAALVADAMAAIPNADAPYEEFVRWGYAVHSAGLGYEVFRQWAAKSSKFDEYETRATWDRIIRTGAARIGPGSIFHEAQRHGWRFPRADQQRASTAAPSAPPADADAQIDTLGYRPSDPPRPLPRATLADAYAFHAGTMLRFYAPPEDALQAPQIQMSGQGGTGKSETAARFAREEPRRQVVLVPEHKVLGAQLVERYRALGIDAAPLLGRGDPFNPQPGDLCQEPEDVAAALKADQDVAKSVCGTLDGPHCRSFRGCPYQAAQARAAAARVVVGAHNHLFRPLSKDIARDVGRLVVEEDFTQHATWIFSLTLESLAPAAIEQWPVLREGERDDHQTLKLRWTCAALTKACDQDGELTAAAMRAAGLRQSDFAAAIHMIRRRKVESSMVPGMSSEARREAAIREAINGQIGKLVTAFAVAQEIYDGACDGRITIETVTTRRGVSRQITVHTMRKVADWAADLPTLLVNGTPQMDVARQLFPRLVERKPPDVATPHAEARLIIGGFAKTTLARSRSKRVEVNRFLKLEAIGHDDQTSLVSFKSVKHELAAGVPGMTKPRHHGQNAGDDELRTTSVHTVTDGIRPPTRALARLVRAKTGRRPSLAPPVPSTARVLMADGSGAEVPVLRYEDPLMQAEYEALHGSSINQAIARARAVMRTEHDPVRINVLGRVAPSDVVFSSVLLWRDVRPGRLGEMVLRRRVHLNAATMAALHGDLFSTAKAASAARAGFGDVWQRVRGWVEPDRRPWVRVRWQRAGKGNGLQWSICPAPEVEDMRAEIVALFGEPVYWQAERFTAGTGEDIPKTARPYVADPGMSSAHEPSSRPVLGAEHVWRTLHPPDG